MPKTTLEGLLPPELKEGLTPAEKILLDKAQKGESADFTSGNKETAKPGNAENWGQVLIGNASREQFGEAFDPEIEMCIALPMPTVQRPELLLPPPAEEIDHAAPHTAANPTDTLALGRYLAMSVCSLCHGSDLQGGEGETGPTPSLSIVAAYTLDGFTQVLREGIGLGGRELDEIWRPPRPSSTSPTTRSPPFTRT